MDTLSGKCVTILGASAILRLVWLQQGRHGEGAGAPFEWEVRGWRSGNARRVRSRVGTYEIDGDSAQVLLAFSDFGKIPE